MATAVCSGDGDDEEAVDDDGATATVYATTMKLWWPLASALASGPWPLLWALAPGLCSGLWAIMFALLS